MEILQLSDLATEVWWSKALNLFRQSEKPEVAELRGLIFQMNWNVNFAFKHLPKLLQLLKRETDIDKAGESPSLESTNRLVLLLPGKVDKLSSPRRVIDAFEALVLLYETCATFLNVFSTDLAVVACDSGSDAAFEFVGFSKVVLAVKETLASIFDRVIFYREKKFETRIQLIAQSLPIISEIAELQSKNKVSPEQAELLRRGIIDGASRFLEAGAMIPEFQGRVAVDARSIIDLRPSLLLEAHPKPPRPRKRSKAPQATAIDTNEEGALRARDDEGSFNDLDPDERQRLSAALRRIRKRKRPKRDETA